MKTQINLLSLIGVLLITQTSLAKVDLGNQLCLEGRSRSERESQARDLLEKALGQKVQNPDQRIDSMMSQAQRGVLTKAVYEQIMAPRACGFSSRAKFDTFAEYTNSLAEDFYHLKNYTDIPGWLHPGYTAVVKGVDSESSIYIETTKDGFVFHDCEGDDGIRTVNQPIPSAQCPTLMAAEIFIPIEKMLHRTNGPMDYVWTVLKAMTGASILFLQNSGIGYASVGAQTAVNLINPQPLQQLMTEQNTRSMVHQLLTVSERSSESTNGQVTTVITRIDDHPFQDLKTALKQMLQELFKSMKKDGDKAANEPNNPNKYLEPGYVMQIRFHDAVNAKIQAAANPAPAPAAAAASAASVPVEDKP